MIVREMNNEKKMNIVLASSYEYVRYAKVLLMSLFETNQKYEIDVYYMYLEKDEENIKPILEEFDTYAKGYHNRVIPVSVPNIYIDNRIDIYCWHPLIYARHAIYDLLPDGVDRIMIMGIDMLVRSDISELYFKDMEDSYFIQILGRVYMSIQENTDLRNRILQQKGCGMFDRFYNGDLLIADVPKMQKYFDYNTFIQTMVEKNFPAPDEDCLNYLFKEHIYPMDWQRWNHVVFDGENIEDIKNAVILHYAIGDKKPWINYGKSEVIDLWWDYARKTEYYSWYLEQNIILHRKAFQNREYELRQRLSVTQELFFTAAKSINPASVLLQNNIKRIAVYGYGTFGKNFLKLITGSDIDVRCIIDANPVSDSIVIPEVFLNNKDLQESIDAVIITSVGYYDEIMNVTLADIIDEIRIITLSELYEIPSLSKE